MRATLPILLRSGHRAYVTRCRRHRAAHDRGHGAAAFVVEQSSARGAPDAPLRPKSDREDWRQARPARAPASPPGPATRPLLLLRYSGDPERKPPVSCAGYIETAGPSWQRQSDSL